MMVAGFDVHARSTHGAAICVPTGELVRIRFDGGVEGPMPERLLEIMAPAGRKGRLGGITHVCVEVEGLDEQYERLERAGMRFHAPPQDLGGGVRTTYGRDPDGNVVELQELSSPGHPAALPQLVN